ncbi:MAG: bifunctional fucokinase/L-fucose-1-P-guanylyltransferase [Clostridia bacterium]|nr:bifunctional fucokinase/L-fucose-1-P-guanylyltransferase [Clostridia bacterium]
MGIDNFAQHSNEELTSLFLKQSLIDSEEDFRMSLISKNHSHWDCIVITASNESQAEAYKMQIQLRKRSGRLPCATDFLIVPDKDNCRVGSAGSTLTVIRHIKEKYGNLNDKKIMVIHAGGNSSRTPQYSALGKLFSPIPSSFDGIPATVFDMFLVTMASMPGRITGGMMLLSGDVSLLFNPLMCDFGVSKAAVISFKEDAQTAKNHGVFLKSESGNVQKFLHKQSIESLNANGAIDKRNKCDIDTGVLWLGPEILDKLFGLVDTEDKYESMVNNKVRLSLYGDIAYCLAENSSLDEFYKEKPEGDYCDELISAREKLWDAIGGYNMKLLTISPARFIHFGSIPEILKLMTDTVSEYKPIGWSEKVNSSILNPRVSGYNSVLSDKAVIGNNTHLEVSYIHSSSEIGSNCYISFTDIHDEKIPDNTFIHGLKLRNGKFVCRIMDVKDNPKENSIFGINLETFAENNNIPFNELWKDFEQHNLWNAMIYPECDTINESVAAVLNVYDIFVNGKGDKDLWLSQGRKSFCSGLDEADPVAIIEWNKRMSDLVYMNDIKHSIKNSIPVDNCSQKGKKRTLSNIQKKWLRKELEKIDTNDISGFRYAIRLYYRLGIMLNNKSYINQSFKLIADTVLGSSRKDILFNNKCHIVKDKTVVKLPLRVNWGGGWTDTCPYCIENGGTVLNAAINLRGKPPVEIKIEKLSEKKIIFNSHDLDEYKEIHSVEELQITGDPFDPFVLQKACLISCGIIPRKGGNLDEILERLGGGFQLHTNVLDVPKGSGLGTSSILSAASVKAAFDFMGIEYDDNKVYSTVLVMEQLMSTGGGWQDQIGGTTPGIKFITSEPGIKQVVNVEHVHISEKTKKELDERFAIIYTGQRRLARNILRNVVGNYIGDNEDSIKAHMEIKKIAVLMKYALEHGNIDEFAKLLNEHWEYSKIIDEGSTNTLIEQIIMSIKDLTDARMICGAGGGGFLQVILKKGITKNDVQKRLKDIFMDFPVDVWDCNLIFDVIEDVTK